MCLRWAYARSTTSDVAPVRRTRGSMNPVFLPSRSRTHVCVWYYKILAHVPVRDREFEIIPDNIKLFFFFFWNFFVVIKNIMREEKWWRFGLWDGFRIIDVRRVIRIFGTNILLQQRSDGLTRLWHYQFIYILV